MYLCRQHGIHWTVSPALVVWGHHLALFTLLILPLLAALQVPKPGICWSCVAGTFFFGFGASCFTLGATVVALLDVVFLGWLMMEIAHGRVRQAEDPGGYLNDRKRLLFWAPLALCVSCWCLVVLLGHSNGQKVDPSEIALTVLLTLGLAQVVVVPWCIEGLWKLICRLKRQSVALEVATPANHSILETNEV